MYKYTDDMLHGCYDTCHASLLCTSFTIVCVPSCECCCHGALLCHVIMPPLRAQTRNTRMISVCAMHATPATSIRAYESPAFWPHSVPDVALSVLERYPHSFQECLRFCTHSLLWRVDVCMHEKNNHFEMIDLACWVTFFFFLFGCPHFRRGFWLNPPLARQIFSNLSWLFAMLCSAWPLCLKRWCFVVDQV